MSTPANALEFEIIDSERLAERLSVPVSWVREQTRTRTVSKIPHLRLGRYRRFLWGSPELELWLKSRIVTR